MHAFTPKQRSKLLTNRNVQDVTEKTVSFSPDFKITSVRRYLEDHSPNQIFEDAGLPLEYFKEDYCRNCIKRWAEKLKNEAKIHFGLTSEVKIAQDGQKQNIRKI